jgi:acyl-CoA thioester hydrolase
VSQAIDLTDRRSFPFWYEEKLRFSDIDMLGHVNNVAYAALIETARIAHAREALGLGLSPGVILVMVRIEIDYRAELHYPATVHIGSRLMRIGRTSLVLGNSVFKGDLCAATSVTTLVTIDSATRWPVPIEAKARAILEGHLASGAAGA